MKGLLYWLLVASLFVFILPASTSLLKTRQRRKKKTSSDGFVRGADYDDDHPRRAGLPSHQSIEPAGNSINHVTATSRPTTKASTPKVTPATLTQTTTWLPLSTNSPIAEPPLQYDGLGRSLSPTAKIRVAISKNVLQSTNIRTSSSTATLTDKGATDTFFQPMINHTNGQQVNPYQCPSEEWNRTRYRLCGYPLFYRPSDCANIFCKQSPMEECENTGGMIAFVAVTIFLGVVIVAGNAILPCLVAKRREMRNNHNYIKGKHFCGGIIIFETVISSCLIVNFGFIVSDRLLPTLISSNCGPPSLMCCREVNASR